MPDAERGIVARKRRRRDFGNIAHTAREPHVADRALASDAAFDEPAKGKPAHNDIAANPLHRLIRDNPAIEPQAHAFRLELHRDRVPLPVAHICV